MLRPAPQRLHPCGEFGQGERFHQIVVPAGAQPGHPIADAAHGGEEQHRRGDVAGAQRAHQGQAVQPGQHAVDDQQVPVLAGGAEQPAAAVRRDMHGVTRLLQPGSDEGGGFRFVLDQQNAQRDSSAPPIRCG